MKTPKTFEEGMAQLDQLLARLSAEDTPLDEAVKLYAQAAQLVAFCSETLRKAKLQIEEIDLQLQPALGKEEEA